MNKFNERGDKEGLWESYIDGKLWHECNYIDGKQNGLYKYYHYNGKLWIESQYLMGNPIGLRKVYNTLGQLKSEVYYE